MSLSEGGEGGDGEGEEGGGGEEGERVPLWRPPGSPMPGSGE
jgi:hypothetical protein